ncbi:interferon-related developmental regulator-domain-containing protein [Xylariaceae sp. FL0662B]|nr:interferon-related developmental regulator-domain-containing protein [Xylariaceae sp. FL0662B]
MPDLRKQIFLESGKTVSRKARSRNQSTGVSPAGSPAPSRGGSRANSRTRGASEEEEVVSDSEYADSLASSQVNSEDGEEEPGISWDHLLRDHIAGIVDRKRSNAEGRKLKLTAYANCIRRHPTATESIDSQLRELIPALLQSARNGSTREETIAALKALEVTMLSTDSEAHDAVYARVYPVLKGVCEDSDEESVKVEAIQALSIAAVCGGGSETTAEDLMEFLIEIVESDGHVIDAGDNGPVVSAALTAWGFVASNVSDLGDQSAQALEAFTDQLDSADVEVQIAAGKNIALLLEAAREYEEETDEPWNMQYDQEKLIRRVTALTKESAKSISKKNRKQLHASFNSVLTSIELGKGPGYSTARRMASNPHTGGSKSEFNDDFQEYGYRETISFGNISMLIDSWSLLAQTETLKAVLGGGLAIHYMENPVVKELLRDAHAEFTATPKKKRDKKGFDEFV